MHAPDAGDGLLLILHGGLDPELNVRVGDAVLAGLDDAGAHTGALLGFQLGLHTLELDEADGADRDAVLRSLSGDKVFDFAHFGFQPFIGCVIGHTDTVLREQGDNFFLHNRSDGV